MFQNSNDIALTCPNCKRSMVYQGIGAPQDPWLTSRRASMTLLLACTLISTAISKEFDEEFKHHTYAKGFAAFDIESDEHNWLLESIRANNLAMQKNIEHTMRHGADGTECDNKCPDWKEPVAYDPGPDCICECDCPCRECTHDNCEY